MEQKSSIDLTHILTDTVGLSVCTVHWSYKLSQRDVAAKKPFLRREKAGGEKAKVCQITEELDW